MEPRESGEAPDLAIRSTPSRRSRPRTQSIRTAAAVPFEVALVETEGRPTYQRIARRALQPRKLGLSDRAIAVWLGVTDKTAAKALRWLEFLDLLE